MSKAEAMAERYLYEIHNRNQNMLIPHWLITSYLYYRRDVTLVTDAFFDRMAKDIGKLWVSLEHFHKHLINPELIKSGFYVHYPNRVRSAAVRLHNEFNPKHPIAYDPAD